MACFSLLIQERSLFLIHSFFKKILCSLICSRHPVMNS
uniref:Uncharacterized protein n=1 Tax=Arundo donax TaxID=35708 RepID=A0A0A9AYB3_ARUDO